jgi:hypothetical protein
MVLDLCDVSRWKETAMPKGTPHTVEDQEGWNCQGVEILNGVAPEAQAAVGMAA